MTLFCLVCVLCNDVGISFFFFNDTATTEIYTLSLHDALPICIKSGVLPQREIARIKSRGAAATRNG